MSAPVGHKILPHCWVCNVRFNNQIPPGPANEERHHVFPQAYGGKEGPQVSLCDGHHSSLHKIANCILSKKDFQHLLAGESVERRKKLIWLAAQVVKAEAATVNDEHKLAKVTLVLSGNDQQILDYCKGTLGLTNRADVFKRALYQLFNSLSKG